MDDKEHSQYRWSRDPTPDHPHGWIQWKGTDVCMDLHCKCGWHGHIDTDFFYYWKCSQCGTVYSCSGYVRMIELDEPNTEFVLRTMDHVVKTDEEY